MADTDTCEWSGASGTRYTYWWHKLPQTFREGQPGNYVFAKIVDNRWVPVYIGQGDLGDRVGPGHHQAACIERKGATHIHVHTNSSKTARESEERDLLSSFPQAYAPLGCNVKEGG